MLSPDGALRTESRRNRPSVHRATALPTPSQTSVGGASVSPTCRQVSPHRMKAPKMIATMGERASALVLIIVLLRSIARRPPRGCRSTRVFMPSPNGALRAESRRAHQHRRLARGACAAVSGRTIPRRIPPKRAVSVSTKNASNRPKSGQGDEHAHDPCERSGPLACDRHSRFGAFFRRAERDSKRNVRPPEPRWWRSYFAFG